MSMFENFMRDVANLQESYAKLIKTSKLTKKNICDLCIPFRDKYNLTDMITLQIARVEYSNLMWLISLFDKEVNI